MREARRWLVHGRVQGVAYRYFALETAVRLELCGWVRNLPDGRVEVQVAGDPAQLDVFKQALHRGPRMARVDLIEEEILASVPGWQEFKITY